MLKLRERVGARLTAGYLVITALMLVVALIGIQGLHSLNGDLQRIVDVRQPKVAHLHALADETNEIGIALRNALLAGTTAEAAPFIARVEQGRARLGEMLEQLDRGFEVDAKGQDVQQALHTAYGAYTVEVVKASRMIQAGKRDMAQAALAGPLQERLTRYVQSLQALSGYESGLMREAREKASVSYSQGRALILAIVVLAAVATAILAVRITRGITRPLQHARSVAHAIAAGDLDSHVDITGRDEAGDLARSLLSMQDQLAQIVGRIQEGSTSIHAAAEEIARGNEDLSRRTEAHAASLEETAASIEQMTGAVRASAGNATQARTLAAEAAGVANRGSEAVARVVDTMRSISESARRINEITSLIDSVAFQTNILALNAAVEAARAGVHGRGFAVVAAEVRELSQRTTRAAQEIRGLIKRCNDEVSSGSLLADQAGHTLAEVVGVTDRVSGIMAQITTAASEQDTGIGQVNSAVTRMDEMTQQNAAMVEQVSAAARSLQSRAGELVETVSTFRLGTRAAPEFQEATYLAARTISTCMIPSSS